MKSGKRKAKDMKRPAAVSVLKKPAVGRPQPAETATSKGSSGNGSACKDKAGKASAGKEPADGAAGKASAKGKGPEVKSWGNAGEGGTASAGNELADGTEGKASAGKEPADGAAGKASLKRKEPADGAAGKASVGNEPANAAAKPEEQHNPEWMRVEGGDWLLGRVILPPPCRAPVGKRWVLDPEIASWEMQNKRLQPQMNLQLKMSLRMYPSFNVFSSPKDFSRS